MSDGMPLVGEDVVELLAALPDSTFVIGEDGGFLWWNDAVPAVTGYTPAEIAEMEAVGLLAPERRAEARAAIEQVAETGRVRTVETEVVTADGEHIPTEFKLSRVSWDGRDAVVGTGRNVADRVERERELERRRDELETLDDVNALVQETIRALVSAADRDDVERTVCERLAESPRYRAVWTAERVSGELEPGTVAGACGFVDAVASLVTAGDEWQDLVDPVGDVTVVSVPDLQAPHLPEPVRAAAREHDVGSGVAVSLSYGDVVYGALVVNAAEPDAFSPRERAAFETLGRAMGLAVNAARHRQLTFAEEAVELVFRATDADDAFIEASREAGCRVDLEGMVPGGEDTVVVYLSVEGAPPERVAAVAADDDRVEDHRVVTAEGEAGVIEAVLVDSPAKRLHESGATVREATAEDGVAELVAEIAPGGDVRGVVEGVAEGFEGVEFVSRQDVERSGSDATRSPDDDLTDRQRSALRAAHLAGYYDWPRGSTAEEVAEALGVTPPTLHQHLRAAESKLVSAFLGGRSGDT